MSSNNNTLTSAARDLVSHSWWQGAALLCEICSVWSADPVAAMHITDNEPDALCLPGYEGAFNFIVLACAMLPDGRGLTGGHAGVKSYLTNAG